MSSLMVSNDLDIMMLEFAVEKLFLPKKSVFDTVIMKKITVMFRMLDSEWISVNPYRTDYMPYKGSNVEEADFHGGKSVVFAIPTGSLEMRMKGVDIQIHVIKEVSKYFEVNPSEKRENVGVTLANVDRLFNGIIKDLREREELKEYLNCFHKRQPISRSLKDTYAILNEDQQQTGATIGIYVRLSYFGKSVITEIERDRGLRQIFYAQEETNEKSPYQCRELKRSELESGCWGSNTFLPPMRADQMICNCDKWGVLDNTDDKSSDEKIDRDTLRDIAGDDDKKKTGKGTGKGRRYRESGESIEKRVRKSSGDHSQVSTVAKVKKGVVTSTKTDKPTRISKSADEKGRKMAKTDGGKATRLSKTLERSGSEVLTGQKQRTTSKDKRIGGDLRDRKIIRKLDKTAVTTEVFLPNKSSIEAKHKKVDVEDPKSSNEYTKLSEQLRKRRRGNVTVGIDEKKKNTCQEAIVSPPRSLLTCPKQANLTSPQVCTNLRHSSPCYYPLSYSCNSRSLPMPHGCFFDSRIKRAEYFCTSFHQRNIPEMQIVTT